VADIEMPQLGETVTEGTITRWFKQVGDPIGQDEVLFEVSTDKVDTEVPSPVAGTLAEIRVAEGETVEVGTVLAVVSADGAAPAPAAEAPAAPASQPPLPRPSPSPSRRRPRRLRRRRHDRPPPPLRRLRPRPRRPHPRRRRPRSRRRPTPVAGCSLRWSAA
jgi:pyruvate/2-oxoglutarate dehydrogenase complex dihydrolipoamide acyltransferase (E2) component